MSNPKKRVKVMIALPTVIVDSIVRMRPRHHQKCLDTIKGIDVATFYRKVGKLTRADVAEDYPKYVRKHLRFVNEGIIKHWLCPSKNAETYRRFDDRASRAFFASRVVSVPIVNK